MTTIALGNRILVQRRFGDEQWDVREFVRPDTFMIETICQEIPFGNAPFHEWAWVVSNIAYPRAGRWGPDLHRRLSYGGPFAAQIQYVSTDYWNLPSETLRDGRGDCEDTAILLTSLLMCRYPNAAYYVTIGYLEDPKSKELLGHAWTTDLRTPGRPTVWDTTVGQPLPKWAGVPEKLPYVPVFRFNHRMAFWVNRQLPPPVPVEIAQKAQILATHLQALVVQ